MPRKSSKHKPICLQLPNEVKAMIDAHKETTGIPLTRFITDAIREKMARMGKGAA